VFGRIHFVAERGPGRRRAYRRTGHRSQGANIVEAAITATDPLKLDGQMLSGQITQSGVSDNFKMLVPVYVNVAKGWARIGSATIIGNSSVELKNIKLPEPAKHVAICEFNDVLALKIQNGN